MTLNDAVATHPDRTTRRALQAAALWSFCLIIAAVGAPLYSSTSTSSSVSGGRAASSPPVYTHTSATLVQVNGIEVLVPVGLPLLVTVVVAVALRRRRLQAKRGAGALAWIALAILSGGALVGMLSVGPVIIPVVALLAMACARSSGDLRP